MNRASIDSGGGARILILDDEPVQRMTVHLHLHGLGTFIDFGEPRAALDHIRSHEVDVVIVDMRMPGQSVDGHWFLAELRKFDRDLGVVLRTADDSVEVAQAAIDSRAVQRVIKAAPNAKARLRQAVAAAIAETRERRTARLALENSAAQRDQLANVLGRLECELTVADLCRGFVQGLTNHVATVAGYSDLLAEELGGAAPHVAQLVARNRAAAQELSARVASFLGTPYLDGSVETATVNGCLRALDQLFRAHSQFQAGGCRIETRGILPDCELSASPRRLLAAIRHLVEYAAARSQTGGLLLLDVSHCPNPHALLSSSKEGLVVNAHSAPTSRSVVFALHAPMSTPLEQVRRDFLQDTASAVAGNLLVVGNALVEDRVAIRVTREKPHGLQFSMYVPAP